MSNAQTVARDVVGIALSTVAVIATLWGFWVGRAAWGEYKKVCYCFEWMLALTLSFTFGFWFVILALLVFVGDGPVRWWAVPVSVPSAGFIVGAFHLWARGRRENGDGRY